MARASVANAWGCGPFLAVLGGLAPFLCVGCPGRPVDRARVVRVPPSPRTSSQDDAARLAALAKGEKWAELIRLWAKTGPPDALPSCLLSSDERDSIWACARAAEKIFTADPRADEAYPALLVLLKYPDVGGYRGPPRSAARIKYAVDNRHLEGMLLRALAVEDPDIRAGALDPLSFLDQVSEAVLRAFATASCDKVPAVRRCAMECLRVLDQAHFRERERLLPTVAPLWARGLGDRDVEVRRAAACALNSTVQSCSPQFTGAARSEVVKSMARALSDEDEYVRRQVASGLEHFGPAAEPALRQLERATRDRDHMVRNPATKALARMAGSGVPALARIVRDKTCPADTRRIAAECLGSMGGLATDAVTGLVAVLQDEGCDRDLRSRAAIALGNIGREGGTGVAPLTDLLKHSQSSVRQAAIKALGAMGDAAESAVPALVEVLRGDPYMFARADAAAALCKIGVPREEVVAALRGAIKDPEECVQRTAWKALAALGAGK